MANNTPNSFDNNQTSRASDTSTSNYGIDPNTIDNTIQLDEYSIPLFDPALRDQVLITQGYNYLDAPSSLDRIQIDLFDQYQSTPIASHEGRLGNIDGVVYRAGMLHVDTFDILTNTFNYTSGKYFIKISGHRNYIYRDDEGERDASHSYPDGIVQFAALDIVEFSRSRTEVRVKARNNSHASFRNFYTDETPRTVPYKGMYWKYQGTAAIFYSPDREYNPSTNLQFATEAEYDAHRASLKLPFGEEDPNRRSGIKLIVKEGEGESLTHTHVGWANDGPGGSRVESTEEIWPVQLRILKPNGVPVDLISTNWMYDEYNPRQVEGELPEDSFDTVIFKLATPAPKELLTGMRLQVTRPLFVPYSIPVNIDIPYEIEEDGVELRGPNLRIDVSRNSSKGTLLKNELDLAGTDSSLKSRIDSSVLRGDGLIQQNTDFRQYKNFVHFSSAKERLVNFKYKLTRIEYYVSKSAGVASGFVGTDSSVTGSTSYLTNKIQYDKLHNELITNLNPYEQYLYYSSHSTETIYESEGAEVISPATWPKSGSTKTGTGYNLFSVSSSQGEAWYDGQLISASIWDQQNQSALRNVIPAYIRADSEQSSYQLFFDMMGEHFDELYLHIKGLEESYRRDESIDVGLSKDLLLDIATSLGWNLYPGYSTSDLWDYVLGVNSEGTYQASGSGETLIHVVKESHSSEIIEKQQWKRLINNLPLLLKTRGTSRGIRALLAAYGIPLTILNIDEYGGAPATRTEDKRAIEKFTYAINMGDNKAISTKHLNFRQGFNNSTVNSLTTAGTSNRSPSMYEVRVDTAKQQTQYIARSSDHAGTGPNWEVRMEHSASAANWDTAAAITAGSASAYAQYGRFVFEISASDGQPAISSSTAYLPIYDNDWWNVSFGVTEHPYAGATTAPESQSFVIRCAKASEHSGGKITQQSSGTVVGNSESYSLVWSNVDDVVWGNRSTDYTPGVESYSGSMQEIRGWAEYISTDAFHQHTLAATSIVGDTVQMAYNDLLLRIPLGTDLKTYDHSSVLTITSSLPNTNNLKYGSAATGEGAVLSGFTNNPYIPKSETYYVKVPHTAGPSKHSNKIRIEDNTLRFNALQRNASSEISSFDSNPLDSEDVSVVLSPADQIDTDISMQFGGFDLDDYIGDPRDKFKQEYTSLRDTTNLYFKKYSEGNSIMAFVRYLRSFNKGLFKQIEDMLPARADAIVGIEIRPNLLERHKLTSPLSASQETMYYTSSIPLRTAHELPGSNVPSQQTYGSSEYGTYTATIGIGAPPSRHRVGSNDYFNLYEGSKYLRDVFGETTESGVQLFVSKSATYTGAEDFKLVPTFNIYHRPTAFTAPVSQSVTGSASKAMSNLYPALIDVLPNYIASPALRRLIIEGTQMSSPDWNVGSTQTIDGGPVAEYQLVNPNIIQVQAPSIPVGPSNTEPPTVRVITSPVGSGPFGTQTGQGGNISVR